ncbi:tetratricopeptide repeat protein [Photobacterium sp. DA100]|uniref:tetratricopeptide repeat protein n=1 Tax=Photobacterium sp. DA100 TaxID=3027472 RepID=UPI00247A4BDD|nr:tetratricopeptide repeat protein [Photobacterium sp. DA100]WEM42589.1 tetratricopeptide repeat protein [Photobacterium sp. DA100]
MSELNKKLSALSRQQGQQQRGLSRSEIKPAAIKPVKQASLKPWATLGVLGLGIAMGIGGWQLWSSDNAVGEVVMAVNPVAPAEAASEPIAAEPPVIAEAMVDKAEKVTAEPQPVANMTEVEQTVLPQEPAKKSVEKESVKAAPQPAQQQTVVTQAPVAEVKAPKAAAPKAPAPKASVQKAPAAKPVVSEPATPEPVTTLSHADDIHRSGDMEIADGEESLMIETVELDAGQLAQIEYRKAEKALKQGDSRKAISFLETTVKYNPEWITARQKLAALYYGRGETRRAMATLQQGLSLDAGQPDLRLTMAKLLVNESQQQAALNVLSQLPSYAHSDYLAMRGALAQQLNQNDLALSSYHNLVKAEPYDGRWWLGLGVALERNQDLAEAEEAYQQALRMGQISGETQQFIRQRLAVLANSKG